MHGRACAWKASYSAVGPPFSGSDLKKTKHKRDERSSCGLKECSEVRLCSLAVYTSSSQRRNQFPKLRNRPMNSGRAVVCCRCMTEPTPDLQGSVSRSSLPLLTARPLARESYRNWTHYHPARASIVRASWYNSKVSTCTCAVLYRITSRNYDVIVVNPTRRKEKPFTQLSMD